MDSIIESYAQLVMAGRKKIEDVPSGLRNFVEDRINQITQTINIQKKEQDKIKQEERNI